MTTQGRRVWTRAALVLVLGWLASGMFSAEPAAAASPVLEVKVLSVKCKGSGQERIVDFGYRSNAAGTVELQQYSTHDGSGVLYIGETINSSADFNEAVWLDVLPAETTAWYELTVDRQR